MTFFEFDREVLVEGRVPVCTTALPVIEQVTAECVSGTTTIVQVTAACAAGTTK